MAERIPPNGLSDYMLAALRDRPGMTRDELHRHLADAGVVRERTTIAARVSRLKRAGKVGEHGIGQLFDAGQLAEATIAAAAHLQTP